MTICLVFTAGASTETGYSLASLIPLGLMVDGVDYGEDSPVVTAGGCAIGASCPMCTTASRSVQSHYIRFRRKSRMDETVSGAANWTILRGSRTAALAAAFLSNRALGLR